MKKEILQYLDSFDDAEYHELNKFLTDNFIKESPVVIQKNFNFLKNFKMIEVKEEIFQDVAFYNSNDTKITNTLKVENLAIKARIADKGRKICEEIKNSPHQPVNKPVKQKNSNKYLKNGAIVLSIILFLKFVNKLLHTKKGIKN